MPVEEEAFLWFSHRIGFRPLDTSSHSRSHSFSLSLCHWKPRSAELWSRQKIGNAGKTGGKNPPPPGAGGAGCILDSMKNRTTAGRCTLAGRKPTPAWPRRWIRKRLAGVCDANSAQQRTNHFVVFVAASGILANRLCVRCWQLVQLRWFVSNAVCVCGVCELVNLMFDLWAHTSLLKGFKGIIMSGEIQLSIGEHYEVLQHVIKENIYHVSPLLQLPARESNFQLP